MIGRTNCGAGGGKVSFSINAVKSETVTITQNGATVMTVTMPGIKNASVAVTLPAGTYSFRGSVGGWTKTATISRKTTSVNVWPDGALFWYGRNFAGGWDANPVYSGTKPSISFTDTSAKCNHASGGELYSEARLYLVNKIQKGSYTALRAKITVTASNTAPTSQVGLNTSSKANSDTVSQTFSSTGSLTVNTAIGNNSQFYVSFGCRKVGSYSYSAGIEVFAIWLE